MWYVEPYAMAAISTGPPTTARMLRSCPLIRAMPSKGTTSADSIRMLQSCPKRSSCLALEAGRHVISRLVSNAIQPHLRLWVAAQQSLGGGEIIGVDFVLPRVNINGDVLILVAGLQGQKNILFKDL